MVATEIKSSLMMRTLTTNQIPMRTTVMNSQVLKKQAIKSRKAMKWKRVRTRRDIWMTMVIKAI